MTHVEHAARRFTHRGKGLRQQGIERLAPLQPIAKLLGLALQSGVSQFGVGGLQRVDALHHLAHALDQPLVATPEDLAQQLANHTAISKKRCCTSGQGQVPECPKGGAGAAQQASRCGMAKVQNRWIIRRESTSHQPGRPRRH